METIELDIDEEMGAFITNRLHNILMLHNIDEVSMTVFDEARNTDDIDIEGIAKAFGMTIINAYIIEVIEAGIEACNED